jgi:hypothetical protein
VMAASLHERALKLECRSPGRKADETV